MVNLYATTITDGRCQNFDVDNDQQHCCAMMNQIFFFLLCKILQVSVECISTGTYSVNAMSIV